jgi:hypothetical protein
MDRNEGSRSGDMMQNEMEIGFRVFFTSSCGFLVGRKRFVERLVAGVVFRPFAVVGSQIGEGKKKKIETMMMVTMSGFRVLGFGLQQAARNVWLTS